MKLQSILPGTTWRVEGGPRRRRLQFGESGWGLRGTFVPHIEGMWRIGTDGVLVLRAVHIEADACKPVDAQAQMASGVTAPLFAGVMVAAALADRGRDTVDFASLDRTNKMLRYVPVRVSPLRLEFQVEVRGRRLRTVWIRFGK